MPEGTTPAANKASDLAALGVRDALSAWAVQAEAAPEAVEEMRLDRNESLVRPFTTSVVGTTVHYTEFPPLRGYQRCHGEGCLLCRLGRAADRFDLLPVYDVCGRSVRVLAVSASARPHSLRAVLRPVLERVSRGEDVLVSLKKLEWARFELRTERWPEGTDRGDAAVAAFTERFEAGGIDLRSVFPLVGRDELAALPEVQTMMKVRGLNQ